MDHPVARSSVTVTPDEVVHRLRALLAATDGNLGAHLQTLEAAGYVESTKDFVGRKPRTRVAATDAGRTALRRHVTYLRAMLDGLT